MTRFVCLGQLRELSRCVVSNDNGVTFICVLSLLHTMNNEDIFSTSGGEEVSQSRREINKRKKLSSGGSVDVSGLKELREEVKDFKVLLK